MWYRSWITGIFGIINAMGLDANDTFLNGHEPGQTAPKNAPSADAGTQHGEACRP
ncbi:hypothetical protein M3I53_07795 [Paraburkholderia sp. CNPSo 3272]|uniref:hypothetical protein n=1 Tax=Paraburkholderia sp. CNPSo 3272 TaxID=2940931 RepID=UPI0020B64118|nr:hypothetical protein [Paraburkholderia sp. CNPSo 3272]MCP3723034.1 hypothetical protein [Paraburkholderia sp. CNPSo 3272]